jgi:predicted secreted hydrolase
MKKDLSGSFSPEAESSIQTIESHHPEFPLEWWFVHGYFEGKTLSRRYFMTSFFRSRLHGSQDAHSLLQAQLDMDAGVNKTVSRIDRSVIDQFAGLDSRLEEFHLDSHLAKAYRRQYQRPESLREIDLDESPISIRPDPLSIQWDDYSLDQKEGFFQLKFRDPASETPCRFSLYPSASKSLGESALKCYSNLRGMEYLSYPQLNLEGRAGGMAVKGEAWLDHQWGHFGWIVESSGQKKILGWDWFGLILDD